MLDGVQQAPIEASSSAAGKPKILLVDDAPEIRAIVSAYFRMRGYDVTEAATEQAAIAVVEAGASEIDLVFVDFGPRSKIKALRLLKLLFERLPDVPVLLSSSDAKTIQAAHALYPSAAIVTKPYIVDEVTARVRSLGAPWTSTKPCADDCRTA